MEEIRPTDYSSNSKTRVKVKSKRPLLRYSVKYAFFTYSLYFIALCLFIGSFVTHIENSFTFTESGLLLIVGLVVTAIGVYFHLRLRAVKRASNPQEINELLSVFPIQ